MHLIPYFSAHMPGNQFFFQAFSLAKVKWFCDSYDVLLGRPGIPRPEDTLDMKFYSSHMASEVKIMCQADHYACLKHPKRTVLYPHCGKQKRRVFQTVPNGPDTDLNKLETFICMLCWFIWNWSILPKFPFDWKSHIEVKQSLLIIEKLQLSECTANQMPQVPKHIFYSPSPLQNCVYLLSELGMLFI